MSKCIKKISLILMVMLLTTGIQFGCSNSAVNTQGESTQVEATTTTTPAVNTIPEATPAKETVVTTEAKAEPVPNEAVGLPVIPGAAGFGMETRAAYAGDVEPQIIKITNLNASGPGSFKEAVLTDGPRVVVFEVSGTIEINEMLNIANPYITIAGQTAPSPGITLKQSGLIIKTHDVLIQHLRIRQGDGEGSPDYGVRDCLNVGSSSIEQCRDVVIDHCSFSWGVDELASVGMYADDVTFSNCIIGEALYKSYHPEGSHSKGTLLNYRASKISIIGNLYAHNHERHPLSRALELAFVNNVVYNWMNKAVDLQNAVGVTSKNSIVGNVFIKGADTNNDKPVYLRDNGQYPLNTGTMVYVHDNDAMEYESDDWDIVYTGANGQYQSLKVAAPPTWPENLMAKPKNEVRDWVLASAGAYPFDRDSVDEKIVNDVINGTGKVIDSQNEVGGFPTLAQNSRTLIIPAKPNDDDDSDGYTNLEEWLHAFSKAVEKGEVLPETGPVLAIKTELNVVAEPTAVPTPVSVENIPKSQDVLFSDDFEDGNTDGWNEVSGTWSIETDGSKVYKQTVKASADICSYTGDTAWNNYSVEAKVNPVAFDKSGHARLFARYKDVNNYYYVNARVTNVLQIRKMVDGSFVTLAEGPFTVATGTWYNVKFVLNGSNLELYVDGNLQLSATDSDLKEGCIGVGGYNSEVEFDDIVVNGLN